MLFHILITFILNALFLCFVNRQQHSTNINEAICRTIFAWHQIQSDDDFTVTFRWHHIAAEEGGVFR